ncbi:Diguanylate cyclase VdcA [Methylorubrum aminovorans]
MSGEVEAEAADLQAARASRERRCAETVWATLKQCGVVPTPRAYEVLFAHFNGTEPEITRRLLPLLSGGKVLLHEHLEELHESHLATAQGRAEAMEAGAQALTEVADDLLEQIGSSRHSLRGYGGHLAHWAAELPYQTSVEGLLKAVTILSLETGRTGERNRLLEEQLSAASGRIERLRRDLADARREAEEDPLTELPNRRAFERTLRRSVAQARAGSGIPFTLLMLDVDHFKSFNDRYGHRTGDNVLRVVGKLLNDGVKGRDTAARFGGEEFAVLLTDADLRAGAAVADRIRASVETRRLVKKHTRAPLGQITVSVGVAQHRPGESGTRLIQRADEALYEAKRAGRNRVCEAP